MTSNIPNIAIFLQHIGKWSHASPSYIHFIFLTREQIMGRQLYFFNFC